MLVTRDRFPSADQTFPDLIRPAWTLILCAAMLPLAARGQIFEFRAPDGTGAVQKGKSTTDWPEGLGFEITIELPYDPRGARAAWVQVTGYDVDRQDLVRLRVNDAAKTYPIAKGLDNGVRINKVKIPPHSLKGGPNVLRFFPEKKVPGHSHGAQFTNIMLLVDYMRLKPVKTHAPAPRAPNVRVYWAPDDLAGGLHGEGRQVAGELLIPDDLSDAQTARLRFQGLDMEAPQEHHWVTINGTEIDLDRAIVAGGGGDAARVFARDGTFFTTVDVPIPPAALKRGANALVFRNTRHGSHGSQMGNVRIIVTYSSPPEGPKAKRKSARRFVPRRRKPAQAATGVASRPRRTRLPAADPARKLFKVAEQLFVMRQYEMARQRFQRLIRTHPDCRYVAKSRQYLSRIGR